MRVVNYLRQGGYVFDGFVCLCVCLSVCDQHSSETAGRIWLKFCLRVRFRPRTNWLTFEPDPDPGSGFGPDFGLFARYLKDFKSDFDETWHAGNARLAVGRASPVCRVVFKCLSVCLCARWGMQQLGGGLLSLRDTLVIVCVRLLLLFLLLLLHQNWASLEQKASFGTLPWTLRDPPTEIGENYYYYYY